MTLFDRFMRWLAPINIGDSTLSNIVQAVTRAGELMWGLVRGDSTHGPWEHAMDPDTCPAVLLPWLAQFAGVQLLPDDTEQQQRYRIRQAAGLYQATPRALVEEVQMTLTGTKTVFLYFHDGDQWHYAVGTFTSETPSPSATATAVGRQNPAGMVPNAVTTNTWSYLVLGPTLVASRVGDTYTIEPPEYPDYQSLVAAFSDYQHLEDNDPDL